MRCGHYLLFALSILVKRYCFQIVLLPQTILSYCHSIQMSVKDPHTSILKRFNQHPANENIPLYRYKPFPSTLSSSSFQILQKKRIVIPLGLRPIIA